MSDIIGFDLDGTLLESFTANPLPGVRERLRGLPAGTNTFLATNQAGPVFRAVLGQAKYPTVERIAENILTGLELLNWQPDLILIATYSGKEGAEWQAAAEQVARDLNLMLRTAIAYWQPTHRKPAPGMLLSAARFFEIQPAEMTYIGDMDSDEQAAARAGCRFVRATNWWQGWGCDA